MATQGKIKFKFNANEKFEEQMFKKELEFWGFNERADKNVWQDKGTDDVFGRAETWRTQDSSNKKTRFNNLDLTPKSNPNQRR